ncbi:carboxypeptidase regulatory-like domain-containing protein [Natronorubrum sp. FCH18a]|uniref:carboxypeptidase-like regulatory domain-containing protein n=1 Tax=Natronorubrum sp. FCH18a TaxID=3447018 RepID=UPI003F51506C
MGVTDAEAATAVATAAAIGVVLLLSVGVGPSSAALDTDSTRLSGTVTDEDGETIFAANVTVNGSGQVARTNADGFYSLELEGGEYEVTAEADGHEPKTWTETLSAGRWTRTDVTLSAAPTELEGTVTNPDEEPVEGATVRVVGTDLETTTDENGSYAFELEPGSHSLETSAEGHNTRRSGVVVAESRVTTRDVQLSDGGRSDDGEDEESDADENGDDESAEEDGEGSDDETDGDDERSDEDEPAGADDTDPDGSTSAEGSDGGIEADASGGDAREADSAPATNREQVLTVLFFAGTFLAAMITAAAVGLYRNRSR